MKDAPEARYHFADVWDAIAERFPAAPALRDDQGTISWSTFEERANCFARFLTHAGISRGASVAQYLYNCPEYLESVYGCFKGAFVPVNINYRYTPAELFYLLDNADVEVVVFHHDLSERCAVLRDRLPDVRWVWVGPPGATAPEWAVNYETIAAGAPEAVELHPRTSSNLYLLYTGGTTGAPKGVMWEQHDLFCMLERISGRPTGEATPVERAAALERPGPTVLVGAPLMHGTASWFSMSTLSIGGCVVTLGGRHFDPEELLEMTAEAGVKAWCIVGDAFGRPIADLLDQLPERWNLSSLRLIFSSGVQLTPGMKDRLLTHLPHAVIVDSLGTSESGAVGRAITSATSSAANAVFEPGSSVRVIDDAGRAVVPGSGDLGRVAVAGHIPKGYFKDPEKTAAVFIEIDGIRHVIAGDWAEVRADGSIWLAGRGSGCINTGGEKVFPEEVEAILKSLPQIRDAVVVGIPDNRLGEMIAAVIVSSDDLTDSILMAHVRQHLAGYKLPRRIVRTASLQRSANGKADLVQLRRLAISRSQPIRLDANANT